MKGKAIICALALLLVSPLLRAQGTVSTRKHRVADFTDKVTQVVLSGNAIVTDALRQEVVTGWTASAFEFCTLEQFEKRKTQDKYYFLMVLDSQFKGEETPGVSFLTLLKGGPEAEKGVSAMYEVVALPLVAAQGGNGRELVYLGGLVKAVQDYALDSMESEKVAYGMENWVNHNFKKWGKDKQILIAADDVASSVKEAELAKLLTPTFQVVDTADADQAYLDAAFSTLVGYVVAPLIPENGASYCYKLLFEAHTRELYYIQKHKITQKSGIGFTADDLKRLAKKR